MKKRKYVELLAPAGGMDMAKAVLAAGADAVYFGGADFGARAYAGNFSENEAADMLDLVHLHKKKAYLTVNTVVKNLEMERKLYDFVRFFYLNGVDGVLVQDFGVLALLREYFPGLNLHASTQMNITTDYGARFLEKFDIKRIVCARELSFDEIEELCKNSQAEIEVFVHGALCVCYSGQCLMSSFLGGRSGNRGRCAQPCRLPYELYNGTGDKKIPVSPYPLSPKDLSALRDLSRLVDAGVSSLKIEGRMKQSAYAATVTGIYRKYLDLCLSEDDASPLPCDELALEKSGSRGGFTDAYFYMRNTPDMMSGDSSSHESQNEQGEVMAVPKIPINGSFFAREGEKASLLLSAKGCSIRAEGGICEKAQKKPLSEDEIRQKLLKIKDSPFVFDSLEINSEDVFLPISAINSMRRKAIEELEEKLLAPYRRKDTGLKSFKPFYSPKKDSAAAPKINVRIRTEEQLACALSFAEASRVMIPACMAEEFLGEFKNTDKEPVISIDPVIRLNRIKLLKECIEKFKETALFEASSYDAIGLLIECGVPLEKILMGDRIYSLSDRARSVFEDLGLGQGQVPIELSKGELLHRDNADDSFLVYGHIPLMYTAVCQSKNAAKCKDSKTQGEKKVSFSYMLKDRKGMCFPVFCDCAICTNTIYNSLPTDLTDRLTEVLSLKPAALELSFTVEREKEINEVFERLKAALLGQKVKTAEKYTRGHFNKGVQ